VSDLMTNPVKYAFPGHEGGVLRLVVARSPEGMRIEVADDGTGLPEGFDPQRSGGLGMRIVTSLVRQVGGRLSMRARDQAPGS
jgi:two-component sensor histidine kinase